jgi:ubiquitin-conjugating enzyme E2 S
MKLVIPEDYPNNPPKGYFLTKIYHPNVGPTGDICVNTLKKDWSIDVTLKHILQVIRCLLIVPFPESSLNDEAGKLFMESYDEFARRAKIMTEVHALPISCDSGSDLKKSIAVVDDSAASAVASIVSEEQKKVKDAKKKSLKRL